MLMRDHRLLPISGFMVLLLGACQQHTPTAVPDWTSYPSDRVTTKPVKMWVAPSLGYSRKTQITTSSRSKPIYESKSKGHHSTTYDFNQTTVGDSAERDVFIVPKRGRSDSEKNLFRLVDPKGKQICGGDYRVVASKYYYGTEATLKMKSIKSAALKVVYRCPVYQKDFANSEEFDIRNLAREFVDQAYFDALSKSFSVSPQTLLDAVKKVAIREGMPIIRAGERNGEYHVLAGKNKRVVRWGRIEQLAALITRNGNGSSITFILPAYQFTYHRRGVLNKTSTEKKGVEPYDRKFSYKRARNFLGYLASEIGTNQSSR